MGEAKVGGEIERDIERQLYEHFRPAFSYSFVNWLRLADPDKLDKSVSSDKNPDLYPKPLYYSPLLGLQDISRRAD